MRNGREVAVAVNKSYSILPIDIIDWKEIDDTDHYVIHNGQLYSLYAADYLYYAKEESVEKYTKLISEYGIHSVDEHLATILYFSGVFELKLPKFDPETDTVTLNNIYFDVKGKTIPVHLRNVKYEYQVDCDKVVVYFKSGNNGQTWLDNTFDDEYRRLDNDRKSVNATTLSKAEGVDFDIEVNVSDWDDSFALIDCYAAGYANIDNVKLTKLTIFENCFYYNVYDSVLDRFNKSHSDNNKIIKISNPVLTRKEQKYLLSFIEPFTNEVVGISKECDDNVEWIEISMKHNDNMPFPVFYKGTRYKGMKIGKVYKIEEILKEN